MHRGFTQGKCCMDAAAERLTLSIPSHPRYLCGLRGFFENLLTELGFNRQESRRITLAIHEACANVIEHGYGGDTQQRIDLTIHIAPTEVTVEVRDYGIKTGIETIKPRALGDVRPGGLGTYFMQSVMDAIVYCPAAEQGMLLRMTKRRSAPCTSP